MKNECARIFNAHALIIEAPENGGKLFLLHGGIIELCLESPKSVFWTTI
jgi:hypothetical protein